MLKFFCLVWAPELPSDDDAEGFKIGEGRLIPVCDQGLNPNGNELRDRVCAVRTITVPSRYLGTIKKGKVKCCRRFLFLLGGSHISPHPGGVRWGVTSLRLE